MNIFNSNHQSNLMIINFKTSTGNILVSYPLKDLPAKLTVDGRRNLIAVVSELSKKKC